MPEAGQALPLASLVVPAYNAETTLAEALESALAQDYEPLEIVVVDDGSTDTTPEIARSFQVVKYVRQENRGPSAARNRGLEQAQGEFIGFLDADDELPPNKMSTQVGFLLDHPNVDCVLGRQELSSAEEAAPDWLARDSVFGDLAGVPLISLVTRRATLLELDGFNPRLRVAEDRDLLVRMRERGLTIEFLPQIVLRRRFHGGNLSFDRPATHPLFGSLKAKLDRGRSEGL